MKIQYLVNATDESGTKLKYWKKYNIDDKTAKFNLVDEVNCEKKHPLAKSMLSIANDIMVTIPVSRLPCVQPTAVGQQSRVLRGTAGRKQTGPHGTPVQQPTEPCPAFSVGRATLAVTGVHQDGSRETWQHSTHFRRLIKKVDPDNTIHRNDLRLGLILYPNTPICFLQVSAGTRKCVRHCAPPQYQQQNGFRLS